MAEIIRIDVIEHKAEKGAGKINRGGKGGTRARTPEEQREQDAKNQARDRAKALKARKKLIRNTIVYTSMAIRKTAQVVGEVVRIGINQSYNRQIFDAQMQGDTRKSQVLQNKKTKATAVTSFVTSNINNIASTAAGFAIDPTLGVVQLVTYMAQFTTDIISQIMTHAENLRQYTAQQERRIKQTEYARKRLLENTFNNRGFL